MKSVYVNFEKGNFKYKNCLLDSIYHNILLTKTRERCNEHYRNGYSEIRV